MIELRRWWARLRIHLFGSASEADLAREIDSHIAMLQEEGLRRGLSAAEARAEARRRLGGIEQTKELYRDARRLRAVDAIQSDLRAAWRSLRHSPTFTVTAVLTLATGMAGVTLMFTLVQGILLRPLPVEDEDQLVLSWRVPPAGLPTHVPYRASDIESLARESQTFAAVSGVGYNGAFALTWNDGGRVFSARTAAVMGEFFRVLGVTPLVGGTLTREHDRTGAERAIVLSFGAWQRHFGGARDVIGRSIVSRNVAYAIVGVMPADFEYPRGVEVWTTPAALVAGEPNADYRMGLLRDVELIGRLRPGVTLEQASDELARLITRLDAQQTDPSFVNFPPVVRAYKDVIVGDIDRALAILFAAVSLLLLIAAVNVANLLLMRGETRRGELAVRAALGASRGRLIAALVVESMVVAVLAGGVGLLLSQWSLEVVTTIVPDGLPRFESIRTDRSVIAFTVGVAFLAAAMAGLAPALSASRIDLVSQLRAGGRGPVGTASGRVRRVLVAAQVALAVTVVAAAGLLGRSLQRLQSVEMGLDHDRLVFAELDPPRDWSADPHRLRRHLEAVTERIGATADIEAVTPLNVEPFAGAAGWELPRFTAEGQTADQVAMNPALNFEAVYVPYFATLGVTIVRGRAFVAADREGAPPVAVVSDAVAAHTWPGQDPIGKRLKFGGIDSRSEWMTVVGVAATTRYRELVIPRPTLYIPAAQFPSTSGRLAIRTLADSAFVARVVEESVRTIDPTVRVTRIASYADYLRVPLAWPRFYTLLLVVFATAALLLSSIGLYGVMAVSVRQRHAELGVRLALGATSRDIRRLVLGEGLRLALVGAIAGLALAWTATRLFRGQLFETEPRDPAVLLGAALLLVGAALVATYVPARRAANVDPTVLLRAD
jgi:predicted permease